MLSPRLRPLITALSGVVIVACFFHLQLANGFSRLFSDNGDGRIEVALLEHWFNVVRGIEPWDRPAFFYPAPETLGYNDGYLLYGLAYSLFRAVGADPFLSSELVNVTVRLFGFYACCALFQALGVRYGPALLGAAVFTLADNMAMQVGHAQLFSVSFAPALAWLAWRAAAGLIAGRPARAAVAGVAAALLFDAWLLTSFYMAWFFALFAVLTLVALLPLAWADGSLTGLPWRRLRYWPLALAAVAGLAGAWPFLMLYLPKAAATGMHASAEMLTWVPAPLDLVHVGPPNLLFGRLDSWLTQTLRPGFPEYGEHSVGLPPLIWLLSLCGVITAWFRPMQPRALWRAIAVAVVASLALMLQVGGGTLWIGVYGWVPGAGAIRVVARYLLFLTFPIVALAMAFLSWQARRWPALAVAAVAALLLVEEVNLDPYLQIDRARENRFLAAVPAVPAACRAFFVENRRALEQPPFFSREDAMLVAETRHIPTLNGDASFFPPGTVMVPSDAAYPASMRHYVNDRGLQNGLCGLDLASLRWDIDPALWLDTAPALPLGPALATYDDALAGPFLGSGWSYAQPTGRWTDGPDAELRLTVPDGARGRGLVLELTGAGFVPPGGSDQVVTVATAAGQRLARWRVGAMLATYAVTLPAGTIGDAGGVKLRLHIEAPVSPKSRGMAGGDPRLLGFRLETIKLALPPLDQTP